MSGSKVHERSAPTGGSDLAHRSLARGILSPAAPVANSPKVIRWLRCRGFRVWEFEAGCEIGVSQSLVGLSGEERCQEGLIVLSPQIG